MPENARHIAALFDQFDDEHRLADWGGDELFTRMPRPRPVDDAPAPRFRPSLVASEPAERAPGRFARTVPKPQPAAPAPRRPLALVAPPKPGSTDSRGASSSWIAARNDRPSSKGTHPEDARPIAPDDNEASTDDRWIQAKDAPAERPARSGDQAMRERAERLGLAVVEPVHRFDESGALIEPESAGRPTKVITGHPGDAPRPLPTVRSERRRAPRTPAEWIGPRPERIVGWAFALGLILILIAISTADAATL